MKLSDYNRLLELRKMPLLSLNDNEYYIVTNSKFAYEVEDNKDIETITVANKNLKLKGYDTKSYWNSITNTGRFVVVLPDKYVQGLEVSENHLIIDTKEDTDAELENKIKEDMQHQLVKVDENGEINDESYRVNVRGAEIEQQKAMVVGECINFPIQRSFVFRSKGNIWYQGMWYLIAFCIVTCIVNSINCIWVAVAGMFVPDWLYNIGTTVLNGGVSMVVFFFVNKIIFPEGEAKKVEA